MKKLQSEFIDALNNQYKNKSSYFWQLAICLDASEVLIDDLGMFKDVPFPPTEDMLKIYQYNIYSSESPEGIGANYSKVQLVKIFNDEVTTKIIENGFQQLTNIEIGEQTSFNIVSDYCMHLHFLCLRIAIDNKFINYSLINQIENLGILANAKAYNLIGYWTGKMEEKRRNKSGGGIAKAIQCEERIKKLFESVNKISNTQGEGLGIDKGTFDNLCKDVLGIKADASYPTKKKYKKALEELIGKKISFIYKTPTVKKPAVI